MFEVQPVADKLVAGSAFTLRDFIFVMRKNQIDTAGVQVERFAEVFHRHRRALDVPAGPAAPDAGVPGWFFGIVWRLPKSEIARVFFLVLVGVDAFARSIDVA